MAVERSRQEETHICEKCYRGFFSLSEFLEHKNNCTKHPPVLTMNDSEGLVPYWAGLSHQPCSSSSKDSHREDGGVSGTWRSQGQSLSCT